MKTRTILVFVILAFLFLNSCKKECDCYIIPDTGIVSEYDLKKSVIQVNSINLSTGFETIFSEDNNYKNRLDSDSTLYAHMCQSVIDPIRFFDDESGYFFVESNNAWMVAHATKPELIGTCRYDVVDINDKYYVRDMVEAIAYKGYGFVEYYFENPETGQDTKKLSYVKSIPVANFFIGTGFYDYNSEHYYTNEEAAMAIVENATSSMAQGISGGFELMADSMGKVMFCRNFIDHIRFFDNHSGYFFIYDFNCVNVAHGTQKDLQGQNLYNYQDSKGNYVIRGLLEVIQSSGSGYYEYYWNNPVTGKEESKTAFVYKIPGIDYFIGSGIYY